MNKRQVLKSIQELVLDLVDNSKRLGEDDEYMKAWAQKQKEMDAALKKLNSCDILWVSENYEKWFNSNPRIKETMGKMENGMMKSEWL